MKKNILTKKSLHTEEQVLKANIYKDFTFLIGTKQLNDLKLYVSNNKTQNYCLHVFLISTLTLQRVEIYKII